MKVALIQQAFKGNKATTKAHTCELIKKAAQAKAQLVCLCELHQERYFCQLESVENFDLANEYEKDLEFWGKIAKENAVVLVVSLFEKRTAGLYHNTALVFEKDGRIAGKYRKMHIPDDPNFYEKFYFTQGDLGFEPINTSVGRLGVLVCWDQWFPEAARIMALKGAQMLIYPTAIGWFDEDDEDEKQRQLEAWVAVQRGHAVANGLPTLAINRVGFEKASECAFCGENDGKKANSSQNLAKMSDGIRFWGNSFAFGAQGEELFRANATDENAFFVELDLSQSERVRRWFPFLRDRRIEAYTPLLKRFDDET